MWNSSHMDTICDKIVHDVANHCHFVIPKSAQSHASKMLAVRVTVLLYKRIKSINWHAILICDSIVSGGKEDEYEVGRTQISIRC